MWSWPYSKTGRQERAVRAAAVGTTRSTVGTRRRRQLQPAAVSVSPRTGAGVPDAVTAAEIFRIGRRSARRWRS